MSVCVTGCLESQSQKLQFLIYRFSAIGLYRLFGGATLARDFVTDAERLLLKKGSGNETN